MRAVQASVANASTRILLGMNTDKLGNDYRWDTCHFNSRGRSAIVDRVAAEIVSVRSDDPSGMRRASR